MTKGKIKIHVGVYLKGGALDPGRLSSVLGVSPTKSRRKGEKRSISLGKEVVAKGGLWALTDQLDADSLDLPAIVSQLGQKIENIGGGLRGLPGVEDGYIDVFAATIADAKAGATCEFELNEQNIDLLQSLRLPIRFTIAVSQPVDSNENTEK